MSQLTRPKTDFSRHFKACLPVLLGTLACIAQSVAQAAPIIVNCSGKPVGEISVDKDGAGISGGFKSSVGGPPPTLADAAKACGEDHFNWYQIVTGVKDGNLGKDKDGNVLTPPWVDPPPGGYFKGNWQDNLPWYWNETLGPGEATTELSGKTSADTLKFADFPGNKDGAVVSFKTWLVSLNADSSFHSWHDGFSWEYVQDPTTPGVRNIKTLTSSPTDAEYKDIIGAFQTNAVPEPSVFALLLAASLPGLLCRRRRA